MCSSPSSVFVLGGRGSSFGVAVAVVVCFVSGGRGSESALVVVSSPSSSSSSSVFVLGDGGGESALVVVSSSPSSVFVSGDGGDLELGVKLFVVLVVLVCFCFGGRRGRVSFGGGVVVAVVCFCFGGRWRFGVGCETVRRPRRPRLFLFWGTEGASQLWWWCRR